MWPDAYFNHSTIYTVAPYDTIRCRGNEPWRRDPVMGTPMVDCRSRSTNYLGDYDYQVFDSMWGKRYAGIAFEHLPPTQENHLGLARRNFYVG